MKKRILLFVCALLLGGTGLSGCQKEEAAAPEPAEIQKTVNNGICPGRPDPFDSKNDIKCGLRTCTNRYHDPCPACGVSMRPPTGCICAGGGSGGPQDPGSIGEERINPNPIILYTDEDATTFEVQVLSPVGWIESLNWEQYRFQLTGEITEKVEMVNGLNSAQIRFKGQKFNQDFSGWMTVYKNGVEQVRPIPVWIRKR